MVLSFAYYVLPLQVLFPLLFPPPNRKDLRFISFFFLLRRCMHRSDVTPSLLSRIVFSLFGSWIFILIIKYPVSRVWYHVFLTIFPNPVLPIPNIFLCLIFLCLNYSLFAFLSLFVLIFPCELKSLAFRDFYCLLLVFFSYAYWCKLLRRRSCNCVFITMGFYVYNLVIFNVIQEIPFPRILMIKNYYFNLFIRTIFFVIFLLLYNFCPFVFSFTILL